MSGFLHLIPISAKKNERCLLIFKCYITVYSEDMHSVAAFPLKIISGLHTSAFSIGSCRKRYDVE